MKLDSSYKFRGVFYLLIIDLMLLKLHVLIFFEEYK